MSTGYPTLLKLLFDDDFREQFSMDRARALSEVPSEVSAAFSRTSFDGLRRDAEGRKQYLMSVLCRSSPLSGAAVGAWPAGPESLSAFLASPRLLGPPSIRNQAYGDHLARLITLNVHRFDDQAKALMLAVLAFERGLVDSARQLRHAIEQRQYVEAPLRPSRSAIKNGTVSLPPFLVVVELPVSTDLLRVSLGNVSAADAWQKISTGQVQRARFMTVARARAMPVTILSRCVPDGKSYLNDGDDKLPSLIKVRHRAVTLNGRQANRVASMNDRVWRSLPSAKQKLATALLEAGVLSV